MSQDNDISEASIKTPIGEAGFKGKKMAEFIAVMSLLVLAVMATLYWQHTQATDRQNNSHQETIKDITKALRDQSQQMVAASLEQASAQRLMACLISLPQDKREKEFASDSSFCQRLSR